MTRARRVVLSIAGGLALVFAVLLVSAPPAGADNCKELVKGIRDLANADKMEDCLRTGNWIGRTVGIVVGTAGIAIAGVGLIPTKGRTVFKPPEPSKGAQEHLNDPDPCDRLSSRWDRLSELEDARKSLEADILAEFREIADKAKSYVDIYADLQAAWSECRSASNWAMTFNTAQVELIIVGLAYAARKVATKALVHMGRVVPPTLEPVWTVGMASFEKTFAALVSEVARLEVASLAVVALAKKELGMNAGLKPSMGSDFTGRKIMEGMLTEVVKRGIVPYINAANKFNADVRQWGVDRQQDIDAIMKEIREEAARWDADAAACAEKRAKQQSWTDYFAQLGAPAPRPAPFVGSLTGSTQLQLPQVQTDFDKSWLFGSPNLGVPWHLRELLPD